VSSAPLPAHSQIFFFAQKPRLAQRQQHKQQEQTKQQTAFLSEQTNSRAFRGEAEEETKQQQLQARARRQERGQKGE
jgi:hypothetical protein